MTPAPTRPAATTVAPRGWVRRLTEPTNLLTSVVLIFPLFLFYQFAVLLSPNVGNGADLLTRHLLRLLDQSRGLYLLVNIGLTLGFVLLLLVLRRKQRFEVRLFLPVMLESAIYALTMGSLILQVMGLIGINPALEVAPLPSAAPTLGVLARIAISLGAGVHEELVFRLAMLSALLYLLHKVARLRRWLALLVAFVVSAALFSAAHHVIGGEPWHVGAFVYRFFCGLFFAALFQWRGLAVAVYSHALYDVYVMVLH